MARRAAAAGRKQRAAARREGATGGSARSPRGGDLRGIDDGWRRRSAIGIAAAAVVVLAAFVLLRLRAPYVWDPDEYYHVGLARVLRGGMPKALTWTPFSLSYQHFSDPVPLYHLMLLPFAGLPLRWAMLAGAALGQALVVCTFAWALWAHRARQAPVYLLALPAMGTQFVERMAMCRPHHAEVAFSVLYVALLLLDAPLVALAVTTALFGAFHASGWMPIAFAALWLLAPLRIAAVPRLRRLQVLGATAGGWLLSQLLNPSPLENLRLLYTVNVTILRQSAIGDAAVRAQIGRELHRFSGAELLEQWPVLLAGALLLVLLLTSKARRRKAVAAGTLALAFLAAAVLQWPRFFELAAPLVLFALALQRGPDDDDGAPARRLGRGTLALIVLLVVLGAGTAYARLQQRHIGRVSVFDGMAQWLGEHARPGEHVFTANWADSAPLFYYAPQVQSMVLLDPTLFWLADPELFKLYVQTIGGRVGEPAAVIRERFGARYVTLWKVPSYHVFANRLAQSGQAAVVYADPYYLVFDLGEVNARPLPSRATN